MKAVASLLAAAALAAALTGASDAAAESGNLQVRINIRKECVVGVSQGDGTTTGAVLDFGAHGNLNQSLDAAPGTGPAAVVLNCTKGTVAWVGLDPGLHSVDWDDYGRRMSNGSSYISYKLYYDAAMTKEWGRQGGVSFSEVTSGAPFSLPIYGRVLRQATPEPGNYTDTVTVRVFF